MCEGQLIALGMLCGLLPGFVVHTHAAEAPAVSAASAVLMDAETGRVLYAHNEQEPRAIASTTKLMTALVAAEYLGGDLSETVEIKREWTGIEGTSLYLKPGETITLKTLLYGLLLPLGQRRSGGPGRNLRGRGGDLCGVDEPAGPGPGHDQHPLFRPQRPGR